MGAGHHDHPTGGSGARHRGRLWTAFVVLAVFMLVEAGAAWYTGSLALLSDSAHMFTDVLGIGMALAAISVASERSSEASDAVSVGASRAGRDPQRTFGLYRIEVLAALANAALLFGVAVYVLVEAFRRFADPPDVLAGPMLAVATAGLAANVVAFRLLRRGARESLNVRGAYLEVLGDLLGSVGVLVAAVVIQVTGWPYADPIIAVAVGLFILPRTWALGRAAVRVLVQAAPEHLDVAAVQRTLAGVPGVGDVHDLHVWTLTSGMEVASAHLTIDAGADLGAVLATARGALHDEYGIDHATLQVEPVGARGACQPAGW